MTAKAAEEIYPLGDQAILIEFGKEIDNTVRGRILSFTKKLEQASFPWMIEYIPAFTTVTIIYDPILLDQASSPYHAAKKEICHMLRDNNAIQEEVFRTISIPVCYEDEFAPDLAHVAEVNSLSKEEVIAIHTANEYTVYMIGFAPGFPYLGGMPETIACPRKENPRGKIPAGSVGIAGGQTGVYPIETPGGWQIIGQTPLALFTPEKEEPSILKAGDRVAFTAVSKAEFYRIKEGGEA